MQLPAQDLDPTKTDLSTRSIAQPPRSRHTSIAYRPDIDGLRAISVLAVILFHAEVPGFAGGFVGVDVFFVISGYLITQVLLTARPEHSLLEQLRDFYVRRCRRILPALLAMLLVATLLACALFLPGDLARFGTHLTFTAGFVSNLAVWRDGGYFDLQAPFAPLLHLWSIAVEEQFYVVFPLIFLASGAAFARSRRTVLAAAALVSFVLCVWASYNTPGANFFLAPTRAWELLLGSLVALGAGPAPSAPPVRDALATTALLAIVACVFWYDSGTRYPGLYALVPCLAAAALLATGGASPVSRWLSAKPLVFTGLISYSLYLWHLPVLAFAGYYHVRPLEPWHLAVLLTVIYLLSAASWRYIEAPIRERRVLDADSRLLRAAAAATVLTGLLGLILWQSQGLPGRLSEADARLFSNTDRLQQDAANCIGRSLDEIAAGSLCRYGQSTGATADVLIWGDSHALALLPAYEHIATAHKANLYVAASSACRPLLGTASMSTVSRRRGACSEFNRAAASAITALDPDVVILNAFWTYPDLEVASADDGESRDVPGFQLALGRTLQALHADERRICVIGQVPKLDYVMPYAYAVARWRGVDPEFVAPRSSEVELRHRDLNGHFEELKREHPFVFVDPTEAICQGAKCAVVTPDGQSIYRDNNHLSVAGAHVVERSLEACFEGIG